MLQYFLLIWMIFFSFNLKAMELVGMDIKDVESENINVLPFLNPYEIASVDFLKKIAEKEEKKELISNVSTQPYEIKKIIASGVSSKSVTLNKELLGRLFPFSYKKLKGIKRTLVYKDTKSLGIFDNTDISFRSLDHAYSDVSKKNPLMIIGPNKENKILVLDKTVQMIDIFSLKHEMLVCGESVYGLVALHPTKKIFLSVGSCRGFLQLVNFEDPKNVESSTLPYKHEGTVMGEDIYQPFLNKAIFIGENLFVGMTGSHIFLYNYQFKKCVWGEITCKEIAKRAGIEMDKKDCIVNNFHYSEKFPDHVVMDFDVVSRKEDEDTHPEVVRIPQLITRYAVALQITTDPSPQIMGSFTFTRRKKEDGFYDYSNNYAFYKFIESSGPELHLDLSSRRSVNTKNTQSIEIHTMPTGLADNVINLDLLMSDDYQVTKLFLKVMGYSKNKNEGIEKNNCSEIAHLFKRLPMQGKKALFCMTTSWSKPSFDQKTQKTYRTVAQRSLLWDILQAHKTYKKT